MEAQWLADRTTLRTLLRTHPHWTVRDFAETIGRSHGWVKKWRKRLQEAAPDDEQVLHARSCARKHPPSRLSPLVVARILEIDHLLDRRPAHLSSAADRALPFLPMKCVSAVVRLPRA